MNKNNAIERIRQMSQSDLAVLGRPRLPVLTQPRQVDLLLRLPRRQRRHSRRGEADGRPSNGTGDGGEVDDGPPGESGAAEGVSEAARPDGGASDGVGAVPGALPIERLHNCCT